MDEYLKYEFEDVIGGGVKTKFKVIISHYCYSISLSSHRTLVSATSRFSSVTTSSSTNTSPSRHLHLIDSAR